MKKKKITYGVGGMMEYQAVVKVGNRNVDVLFTDGSVSAMGTNPATFTTDNIILQHAIERSGDYKRELIKTVNVVELDEELNIVRPSEIAENAEGEASSNKPRESEIDDEGTEAANVNESMGAEKTLTKIEFSCNDDAKDYLEDNYGYVRSKLRNREDIVNAGKAHDVEIVFI